MFVHLKKKVRSKISLIVILILQATIGHFITYTGDAVRGTLQWENFPRAIGVEFPYVVALLRNNVVEVQNMIEQKLVQSVQLKSKLRTISTGPGIKVKVAGLMDR